MEVFELICEIAIARATVRVVDLHLLSLAQVLIPFTHLPYTITSISVWVGAVVRPPRPSRQAVKVIMEKEMMGQTAKERPTRMENRANRGEQAIGAGKSTRGLGLDV